MKLRKGWTYWWATHLAADDLYAAERCAFQRSRVSGAGRSDRMLDMGFIRDIRKILAMLPAKRQSLLLFCNLFRTKFAPGKGLQNDRVQIDV